ncbi:hypothetical protein Aperf_G00000103397 [Anoplocephala perfoliata]
MNYKYSLPFIGSFPQFVPELGLDPVLTYVISGEESGYSMDVTEQDEDEGSELFGTHFQSQSWNAGFSHSSSSASSGLGEGSGPVASISSSFAENRFLRLSSNDFQPTEDLQTSFGDLNTSEDASPDQYCFNRPVDRVSTQLEDFEEGNGFDSGFGSLQLTPTEIQSEGICENSSPQSAIFWETSAKESIIEIEEQAISSNFSPRLPSQQTFQLKRCSTMVEYSKTKFFSGNIINYDSTLNNRSTSSHVQGGHYSNGVLPSSQLNRNNRSSVYKEMPSTAPYIRPSLPSLSPATVTHALSSSSPSSYPFETSRSASSPVSHRNLNKRVAQQEANEFLSSSEGGNWDENFDDIDGFGIETDFDENVFPAATERSSPQASSSHGGGYRNCHSFSLKRGQHSPLTGGSHRRSRSTALATTSFERPRKTGTSRNGGRKRNLLNFILELLTTRQTCVEWVDKPKQVFQIVNPDQLTRLWGEHKNNVKMSFDSLSRSLRLYYKPGKLERIPGTRHQYRLIQKPPEGSNLLRESPYGCSSEHRKSGVPMTYPNSLKQQSTSQKPYL